MPKPPKRADDDERSPEEAARTRDAILKRMLQTKPKHQRDLMAERKAKRTDKTPPKR
jgi:hypothetical protein